jgi:hypothetical protein
MAAVVGLFCSGRMGEGMKVIVPVLLGIGSNDD